MCFIVSMLNVFFACNESQAVVDDYVIMETSLGDIEIQLYPNEAPITVDEV